MAATSPQILGDIILGVDGGGTKTVACLARNRPDGEEEILGRGQAGSSNVKAVGLDQAHANLQHAIQAAWKSAKLPPEPVALAVLGLSGAGQPETQASIADWVITNQVARRARIVHDALPVLVAGTPQGAGVALIAGTGAVAFAADSQQNTAIAGGWGYWFGDEGSAFWLGQSAARAASHAVDGRTGSTLLTQAILNRLEISDPRAILTTLAQAGDVRSALAELADLVSESALQRDPVAEQIVAQAAQELASLVTPAAEKLHLGTAFPLALAGGVLCGSQVIREALLAELAVRGLTPTEVEIVADPVVGCLRLATRELASGNT